MTRILVLWSTALPIRSKPDLYHGWQASRAPNQTREDLGECLMYCLNKINSDLSTIKTLHFQTKLTNLQPKYSKGSKINLKIKTKDTNFSQTKTPSWTWKVNLIINFHRFLRLNLIIKPNNQPQIAATYKIRWRIQRQIRKDLISRRVLSLFKKLKKQMIQTIK